MFHLTDRAEGSCAHATCSTRMSDSEFSERMSHHTHLASTAVICRRVGRLQALAVGPRRLVHLKPVLGLPNFRGTPCTQQRHGQQYQGCQANIYSSSQPVSIHSGNAHMHDGFLSSASSAFDTMRDTVMPLSITTHKS